jgi:hypothetical protein
MILLLVWVWGFCQGFRYRNNNRKMIDYMKLSYFTSEGCVIFISESTTVLAVS